jgi:hypothetical protein
MRDPFCECRPFRSKSVRTRAQARGVRAQRHHTLGRTSRHRPLGTSGRADAATPARVGRKGEAAPPAGRCCRRGDHPSIRGRRVDVAQREGAKGAPPRTTAAQRTLLCGHCCDVPAPRPDVGETVAIPKVLSIPAWRSRACPSVAPAPARHGRPRSWASSTVAAIRVQYCGTPNRSSPVRIEVIRREAPVHRRAPRLHQLDEDDAR